MILSGCENYQKSQGSSSMVRETQMQFSFCWFHYKEFFHLQSNFATKKNCLELKVIANNIF
jgi:hypothetical protein